MEEKRTTAAKGKQKSSQQSVPVQQDFLFIDSSKPAQSSRQGRRNARSFVMQRARRERPWSTSKHGAGKSGVGKSPDNATTGTPRYHTPFTQPVTPTTPADQPSARRHELTLIMDTNNYFQVKPILCLSCKIFLCRQGQRLCPMCLSLQPTVAEGVMDPFGSFPVKVNSKVSELLNHFLSVMSPSAIAVDVRHKSDLIRTDWFGTAVSNPGFMHSLLCTSALHLYALGKGSFLAIDYHKNQAISAIKAVIADPVQGISDANIGAVFNLLCVEESLQMPIFRQRSTDQEEHSDQRLMHLNGLQRMVELRGGLHAIQNRCLQAFILWHSTAHAIASFEPPYLSALEPSGESTANLSSGITYPPDCRPLVTNHFVELCRKAPVKHSLVEIVERILLFTSDLNAWFSDEICPLDPLDIQNHASVLEVQLLQWLQNTEHLQGPHTPLEDSLCVALLILVVRASDALRLRSESHHLHYKASKRLQKALSATSRLDWYTCSDLLLWILSIGAISAQGSVDCAWFVFQASTACSEVGIDSAKSLLEHLRRCIWVGFKLDGAVEHLWEMITHLRLQPSLNTSKATGPLQYQVSEPDLMYWQSMDWMSLNDPNDMGGSPYMTNAPPLWGDKESLSHVLYQAPAMYIINGASMLQSSGEAHAEPLQQLESSYPSP